MSKYLIVVFVMLSLLLSACSTTKIVTETNYRLTLVNNAIVTDKAKSTMSNDVTWAVNQGFKNKNLTISLDGKQVKRGDNYGILDAGSPTGADGGYVESFNPPCIVLPAGNAGVNGFLKHELFHIILWQNGIGNGDPNHTDLRWKSLGLF